ncbi:MAG: hypothetical protein RI924_599 [Bacteroidota bacterium]|jgi:flavin reductase (DIM6/NTAB) family NADH-FMN oxidoreductase RutF
MKIFTSADIAGQDKRFRTTFINSLSGFKSVQLLGTISPEGKPNLAIFNSIFHVGAHPPLLGHIIRPKGPEHDTLENIIQTAYYTLNNVQEATYKQAHQTSARYLSGESEFEACGLEAEQIAGFPVPFVKAATIQIGLRLREVVPLTVNETKVIIGEIELIRLDEKLIGSDGYVDLEAAGSITCAGLDSYHRTEKIGRLAYAKPGVETKEL